MAQHVRRFLSQNANCECSQLYACRLLFLPLKVAISVMMMVMSFSLALGSIDLNAQCGEGDFFQTKN